VTRQIHDLSTLVAIVWDDSCHPISASTWHFEEDTKKWAAGGAYITSVGFMLEETKDHVLISMSRADPKVGMPFRIPRGAIESITPLVPRRRK
jgi:hypothetical protein